MRQHEGFAVLVGSALIVVGAGLASVGVTETPAAKGHVWGNVWFIGGVAVGAFGGVVVLVAVLLYWFGRGSSGPAGNGEGLS